MDGDFGECLLKSRSMSEKNRMGLVPELPAVKPTFPQLLVWDFVMKKIVQILNRMTLQCRVGVLITFSRLEA